jgi:hypothetical protein
VELFLRLQKAKGSFFPRNELKVKVSLELEIMKIRKGCAYNTS